MDKKAKQILFSYYWSAQGWVNKNDRKVSDRDLEYAKQKEMMFDPISFNHDSLIKKIKILTKEISFSEVVSAFCYSLENRALNFRSCLSSYVYASNLSLHSHNKKDSCPVCGCFSSGNIDLNVLNFERHKWGGVRLLSLEYIWFDLMRFKKEKYEVKQSNNQLINNLSFTLSSASKGLSASKIQQELSKHIKSNKAEREVLLGVFGICNILNHPEHQGFLYAFTEYKNRQLPDQRFIDLEYPFCWYNSDFGVNEKALENVFKIKKS
jgi:hypothetical protein